MLAKPQHWLTFTREVAFAPINPIPTSLEEQVVADQIRLWHQELRRLQAATCTLYSNWESATLYSSVAQFAERLGAVQHRNDAQHVLVVGRSYHEAVRDEIRRLKAGK